MIATRLLRHALALALGLAIAGPAAAQQGAAAPPPGAPAGFVAPAEPKPDETNAQRAKSQPGNNAPMWRAVRESGPTPGVTTAEGPEAGTLIQGFTRYPGSAYTTAGEAWRQVRNGLVIPYGGALLVLVALSIAIFYWRKGVLGGQEPDTGRVIERFTPFERAAHWANAVAFLVLAVSGIVMAFGKFFLLPIIGGTLFGWLTYALKTAHNFAGPVFAVSLLVVIVTFARDNLPRAGDLTWLLKAGGLLGKHQVPSHRYNAAEKLVFWAGVFVAGLVVVASGLVLDKLVPGIEYTRAVMQIANIVHGVAASLLIAMFIGHIYIGTIGMKGAYAAMRTGYVDEAWAKEHHELWYQDIKAGKIPARRSADPLPPAAPATAQH
jgi:formate dehydrogenase subunit gamma